MDKNYIYNLLKEMKDKKQAIENILMYRRSINQRENLTMLDCSIAQIEREL